MPDSAFGLFIYSDSKNQGACIDLYGILRQLGNKEIRQSDINLVEQWMFKAKPGDYTKIADAVIVKTNTV